MVKLVLFKGMLCDIICNTDILYFFIFFVFLIQNKKILLQNKRKYTNSYRKLETYNI